MSGVSLDQSVHGRGDEPVVVPRVSFELGGAAQPLDRVIGRLLATSRPALVALHAPPGGGKSTALAHLRNVLGANAPLDLVDPRGDWEIPRTISRLMVVACTAAFGDHWFARLHLCPWGEDDWIEYCAARHRDKCPWILARLRADEHRDELEGNPRLWRIVLDEMAADEKIPDAAAALRTHLRKITTPAQRRDLADLAAWTLVSDGRPPKSEYPKLPIQARVLSEHYPFRMIVAAADIAEKLAAKKESESLAHRLSPELIRHIAVEVRQSKPATQRLEQILVQRQDKRSDAMAASILLAADPFWHMKCAYMRHLDGAKLAEAKWAGADLRRCNLGNADLHAADLQDANLTYVNAVACDFRRTSLVKARLGDATLSLAKFTAARLCDANLASASCEEADFSRADLRNADCSRANFSRANFSGAQLLNTSFVNANLSGINIDDADFIGTELAGAVFSKVRLSMANFSNVSFSDTQLIDCDLEGMRLGRANFYGAVLRGSVLTGSHFPNAKFGSANLCNTGLAEIDWENADLRDADLRGATFHMGSSRSGLVGSPIACEGSRTGFYTDDYNDQDFKNPEEIRKANLCGADLRGANVDDVDFYLVDLRGAKYTQDQGEHFARCGAILRSRVA